MQPLRSRSRENNCRAAYRRKLAVSIAIGVARYLNFPLSILHSEEAGEKVCILWLQPIRKKKEEYAWSASGHSSRMYECRLLRVKPERGSKKMNKSSGSFR